jgi:multiple sugar transport system permease protein
MVLIRTLILLLALTLTLTSVAAGEQADSAVSLRVPLGEAAPGIVGPASQAERRVITTFSATHPKIAITGIEGLQLPGGRTMDMVPFMQIAGGIAPDVLDVNFRSSATLIDMQLLHPLDDYVEAMAGATLTDGSALSNVDYFASLQSGTAKAEIQARIPPPCQDVMRRRCPFAAKCPYRASKGLKSLTEHRHVWCFPAGALVTGIMYDRGLLAEHASDGIEPRAPKDWNELIRWAKALTRPDRNEYGLDLWSETPSWRFLTFLYSAGGRVVEELPDGQWRCTLDSDALVEAAYFYARLRLEKIERNGTTYRGVTAPMDTGQVRLPRYGFSFCYLDQRFLTAQFDRPVGFGPAPRGPTGIRGSEFNARMLGIFAGIADGKHRDAAWEYIRFMDGDDARRIRTESFVNIGLGDFIQPAQLRRFNDGGRYDDLLSRPNIELEEAYREAFAAGVPEPYGPNCQYIYEQMNRPLGEMLQSRVVRDAIDNDRPDIAKREIRRIFMAATENINRKVLRNLPPSTVQTRNWVAWAVIVAVATVFAWMFRRLLAAFKPVATAGTTSGGSQSARQIWVWVLLLPALLSIGLWSYWPLLRGTFIAFQDYNVNGSSRWVGATNFAEVLFDADFWYSMKLSAIYTILFLLFGFWVPIALALLLSEIPKGKSLFRTIYYLPAVLSGLVVILLWKSFYAPEGLINTIVNNCMAVLHSVFGTPSDPVQINWLEHHATALFCCLLPTIWAGMGPGCLIYLAALKTVPEEIYEAADIDGAGIRSKVFHIALPSIKALILINLVGAVIAAIRGAGGFVLAMTGGGPYAQQGGATEIIGLKIFYTTFGALKFGTAAAMAWVLGAMLIGFTVVQLQRLSSMEFKTAAKEN